MISISTVLHKHLTSLIKPFIFNKHFWKKNVEVSSWMSSTIKIQENWGEPLKISSRKNVSTKIFLYAQVFNLNLINWFILVLTDMNDLYNNCVRSVYFNFLQISNFIKTPYENFESCRTQIKQKNLGVLRFQIQERKLTFCFE